MYLAAGLIGLAAAGALGFSHGVKAVGRDESVAALDGKAAKEERKRLAMLERQRKADEKRNNQRVAAAKAIAEQRASFGFYENLVGQSWPVPVEDKAYNSSTTPVAAASSKVDLSQQKYSLQAALVREEAEANDTAKVLAKMGYATKVDDVKVKAGGILYRVTVGPFDGLDKANQIRDVLQAKNYYAQVFRD